MRLLVNVLFAFVHKSRLCQSKLKSPSFVSRNVIAFSTMTTNSDAVIAASTPFFKEQVDRFNGVTINSESVTYDISSFGDNLDSSITKWKEEGRRGIWFRVHLDQSDWVPILAKKGFRYHHAKDDFVMMYLWLPEENCNIPQYAHTMIGVGAVVVNENAEILVVSEKYYAVPHWKLPGGYVEPGENLVDAAIREVLEETGVKTEFQSLLTLRHTHNFGMFGCSDIYTVVSLKPLSSDIEMCEREIVKCKWMGIEEYLNHPNVHELNRFFVHKYLEYLKKNVKIDWHHGIHQLLKKAYTVYFIADGDKSDDIK